MKFVLVIGAALLVGIVIIGIMEIIDGSPVNDSECRGGHDF